MKTITVDGIMALGPCKANYPRKRVQALFGKRKRARFQEIAATASIPLQDRLWLLIRMLPVPLQREAACRFAEMALNAQHTADREPDPRSWNAITVARRYIRGEATNDELEEAAEAAEAAWVARVAAEEQQIEIICELWAGEG